MSFFKILVVILLLFNERLKEIRKSKNITQLQVATFVGITDRYYQELEYGKKEPTLSKLLALADFFEVSLDYLTGRTDK